MVWYKERKNKVEIGVWRRWFSEMSTTWFRHAKQGIQEIWSVVIGRRRVNCCGPNAPNAADFWKLAALGLLGCGATRIREEELGGTERFVETTISKRYRSLRLCRWQPRSRYTDYDT
jgi:hypothetical protein